ncbi:unnamed protein product [Symbiodinium microadriaticum]|nr:unnamed protein product [Symbiodinium microadriaticum]
MQGTFRAFAAIRSDGSVTTWGEASFGGDSQMVSERLKDVIQIEATGGAFAALTEDGDVVTWGMELAGGDTAAFRHELRGISKLSACSLAFAALREEGTVVTWGHAQFGGDSRAVQDSLTDVRDLVSTGGAFAALLADGSVVAWGFAECGGDISEMREQLQGVRQLASEQPCNFVATLSNGGTVRWGADSVPVALYFAVRSLSVTVHHSASTLQQSGCIRGLRQISCLAVSPSVVFDRCEGRGRSAVLLARLVVVCVLSSLASSAMLLASIRAYPDNKDYDVRVEYGTLCRHHFPRSASVIFQGIFQLAMLAANVSNIIQTAQVFDYFFVDIAGESCAIELFPDFQLLCRASRSEITPFGAGKLLISAGMVSVAAMSIPLGYWNLEENVRAQNLALLVILLSISSWVVIFCALGLEEERVPAVGSSFHHIEGTVLFNFMFVSTLPSWVCEKNPNVRPMRTITLVLMVATVAYILVGLLGGMAFEPFFNTSNTLLSELQHIAPEAPKFLRIVAKSTIQAYSISANLASIPIFCILMRYNLQDGMGIKRFWASAIANLAPFFLAIAFYGGKGFQTAAACRRRISLLGLECPTPGLQLSLVSSPRKSSLWCGCA